MPRFRTLVLLVSLVGAVAVLVTGVANADAAKSRTRCWQLVLNDEYDGDIDGTYPVDCYRQATAHLPKDSLVYGQLKQDVTQAMLKSLAAVEKNGVKVTAATPLPPEDQFRAQHKTEKAFLLRLVILAGLGLLLIAWAWSFAARWITRRR